jgi:hypothetical protein
MTLVLPEMGRGRQRRRRMNGPAQRRLNTIAD